MKRTHGEVRKGFAKTSVGAGKPTVGFTSVGAPWVFMRVITEYFREHRSVPGTSWAQACLLRVTLSVPM